MRLALLFTKGDKEALASSGTARALLRLVETSLKANTSSPVCNRRRCAHETNKHDHLDSTTSDAGTSPRKGLSPPVYTLQLVPAEQAPHGSCCPQTSVLRTTSGLVRRVRQHAESTAHSTPGSRGAAQLPTHLCSGMQAMPGILQGTPKSQQWNPLYTSPWGNTLLSLQTSLCSCPVCQALQREQC